MNVGHKNKIENTNTLNIQTFLPFKIIYTYETNNISYNSFFFNLL